MKYRLLTLLGLIALSGASMPAWSQDYDDVYYDAKKDNVEKTILKPSATQVKSQPQRVVITGNHYIRVRCHLCILRCCCRAPLDGC